MAGKKRKLLKAQIVFSNLKSLLLDFKKENLLSLLLIFFAIVIAGGILVFIVELDSNTGVFNNVLDGLWWGIVTLTTVGYGDFAPKSIPARIISVIIMLSGVVITSILSGTIASVYVDRKIREGKGMQEISLKNHILICGWNRYGNNFIESLLNQYKAENLKIAIISEMTPEEFDELRISFPNTEIRFIRGDIANETILRRGSLISAKSCVIIPDESGGKSFLSADDKTILSAFAIKGLNPKIHLTAQIIHNQNLTHLERAKVDEIVFGDNILRHILSGSTIIHGVPTILNSILDPTSEKRLRIQKIPVAFEGKAFRDYVIHILNDNNSICIGILSEVKSTNLLDVISADSSGIDAFIRRKFSEADINLDDEYEKTLQITVVPDVNYVIKAGDSAFIIGGV